MIVVGGQAPKAIRSVECYDFEEERWDQVAELPSRRCRAGNGNVSYSLLHFPCAAFQGWTIVSSIPSAFLSTPSLKQLFAIPFPLSLCTCPSYSGGCPAFIRVVSACPLASSSLSWLFHFPSSSCPTGCGNPQASSFLCWFPSENHRS